MLPDDYIRKMKQDLAEVEAQVESKTRYEPDPESYNVDAFDVHPFPEDDEGCTTPPSQRDFSPPNDTDALSSYLASIACPR
jgi:hypothetical protein